MIELGFLGQGNIPTIAAGDIPYDQLKTTKDKIERINTVDDLIG